MRSLKIVFLISLIGILGVCQSNTFPQGESLYLTHCSHCHMSDGQGLRGLIPTLANSDYMLKFRSNLPCIIKYGLKGSITVNNQIFDHEMPGVPYLKPVEIQNIINYITSSWGNDSPFFQVEDVTSALENCK